MRPLLLALLLLPAAWAGRRPKPTEPDPSVSAPSPKAQKYEPWFPGGFPIDVGTPSPPSAQACAACHPGAVASWRSSAHSGAPSAAFLAAVDAVGDPACTACHLPLVAQQPWSYTFGFQPERPSPVPQPFSVTLYDEGVTCAACHLRGDVMLGRGAGSTPAHGTRASTLLGSSEGCAACHQLETPGGPAYDTWGEWSRSAWAQAGIGCLDCHGRGGLDGGHGVGHATSVPGSQGLTMEVSLDRIVVPRVDADDPPRPVPLSVRLTNTGAGHDLPSGSPYRDVALFASLRTTVDGKVVEKGILERRIRRDQGRGLRSGESVTFDGAITLTQQDPPGPWTLEVGLHRVVRDQIEPLPLLSQQVSLGTD